MQPTSSVDSLSLLPPMPLASRVNYFAASVGKMFQFRARGIWKSATFSKDLALSARLEFAPRVACSKFPGQNPLPEDELERQSINIWRVG